ncbi:homeodomain transcription factor bE2 [Sporisorium reilianum f. sp. reilianum]|uniref:Homeodomain transcription factor bE2 n=1 Tax=Sporisorium reilianum f. sp. reilianum TaxID=72559 RepID=A0A2N8U8J5_9BASI|nr:homeodomain transcription factor bE2 [Sporisorium reilianum f. sp. reilianum]DBA11489.1 TPA_inf: bE [Sporisorium reilianum f. sp. reilianum]
MTPSSSFSLAGLLQSLRDIEHDLLSGEEEQTSDLVGKLKALQKEAAINVQRGSLDQKATDEAHQAAQRIQVVATARLSLEKTFEDIFSMTLRQARETMEDDKQAKRTFDVKQDLSETLPSYHMRRHFLTTLDNPYPSQADKEVILRITNDSAAGSGRPPLDAHQLTLWFINARRRSGWTHILRKFARGDRSRMKVLIQTKMFSSGLLAPVPSGTLAYSLDNVLSDNLRRPLTPADKTEFEEDWDSMLSWIKYGVKEKVGEWVYDLVAASKKPPKAGQARAVTTPAKRAPARKTATPAQSKPRKPKQRASKTPSIDSVGDHSALESTPELSMCSTADTSLSSFASNLSMMQYDPFQHRDDLLQSPTLHAKSTRRVKALPKRATQHHSPHKTLSEDESATGTCLPVPEDFTLSSTSAAHAQAALSTQPQLFPPYDFALGQAPMPLPNIRRESLSSNSLSAAFG